MDIVLSTSTTEACDLVLIPRPLMLAGTQHVYETRPPLLVEVKTVGRGHSGGALTPLQEALRLVCGAPGAPEAIFVHAIQHSARGKRAGPWYDISSTPPSPWARLHVLNCIRMGEAPPLAAQASH